MITLCFTANAQIISTSHVTSQNTSYTSTPQDVIYFYKQAGDIILSANPIDNGGNNTFTWSQYDAQTGNWNFFQSQIGVGQISNISEGGYQVIISNGSTTQTYRCWVLVPGFENTELNKAETDTIYSNCREVKLAVTNYLPKTLTYYNPANKQSLTVNYTYSFVWYANDVEAKTTAVPECKLSAPYDDTSYKTSVTELLSNQSIEASAFQLTAIAVYADFEIIPTTDDDNDFHTNQEESSRLEITTDASSESANPSKGNIKYYDWKFDTYLDPKTVPNSSWSFTGTGTHTVGLKVYNDFCTDTSEVKTVTLTDMELKIPNYFNPDADDEGVRKFKVTYHSIKSFDIVIVNRWGRPVYKSTNIEEGWDGRIGGQKAAPGVYYYDIVAKGFNSGESMHKKGFLHLMYDHK